MHAAAARVVGRLALLLVPVVANSGSRSKIEATATADRGVDPQPTCESPALAMHDYCNHSLPIDARVEDLLGHLTMVEKTASVLEAGGSVPRLGVPHLGTTECLRGYLSMFPQALAMSQSWNRSLVRAVAAATSDEVRAAANEAQGGLGGGSLACFDPVINICRDLGSIA